MIHGSRARGFPDGAPLPTMKESPLVHPSLLSLQSDKGPGARTGGAGERSGMGPSDITPFVFRHPVSAGTHLLGCLWALLVARVLWALARGDHVRQRSVGCF